MANISFLQDAEQILQFISIVQSCIYFKINEKKNIYIHMIISAHYICTYKSYIFLTSHGLEATVRVFELDVLVKAASCWGQGLDKSIACCGAGGNLGWFFCVYFSSEYDFSNSNKLYTGTTRFEFDLAYWGQPMGWMRFKIARHCVCIAL